MSQPEKPRDNGTQGAAASLLNGLRVLEAFRAETPALGVTEVARRVGLHKSTVSRILAGLAEAGYLHREPSGRYRLSWGVIGLAGPLLAELDVRRLAQGELEELTEQTQETSALSVWNGAEAVVVEQFPSPQFVKHTAYIGTRYDRFESSSVQVFLAHLDEDAALALLTSGQIRRDAVPAVTEDVTERLARVRQDGYAVNDGDTNPQELGISAPVRNYDGAVVGCVTLSAPRARIAPAAIPQLTDAVQQAAQRISDRFGGRAGPATGVRAHTVIDD